MSILNILKKLMDIVTKVVSVKTRACTECFSLSCQGFYSVSGSSLSDSCYSVSSDAAQSGAAPPARPLKLWEQVPLSTDNPGILWSEGAVQQHQPELQNRPEVGEPTEETPALGELVQTVEPCHVNVSMQI